MAWLVHDDRVLASLELAETRRARLKGLLGRDRFDGALLLRPARGVHTFGMRFPIDVAVCDRELRVRRIVTMAPRRIGRLRLRSGAIIETEAGCFARWGIGPGDQLEVRA